MSSLPRALIAAVGAATPDNFPRKGPRPSRAARLPALVFALAPTGLLLPAAAAAQTAAPGQLVISEFRLRGPNGGNDEFVEIYNNTGADHTVVSASGTGYGIAASDGVTRCSIPRHAGHLGRVQDDRAPGQHRQPRGHGRLQLLLRGLERRVARQRHQQEQRPADADGLCRLRRRAVSARTQSG